MPSLAGNLRVACFFPVSIIMNGKKVDNRDIFRSEMFPLDYSAFSGLRQKNTLIDISFSQTVVNIFFNFGILCVCLQPD